MTTYRDIVLGIKTDRKTIQATNKLEYHDRECLNIVVTNLLTCVEGNDILLYSRKKERADKWSNNPLGVSNYRVMSAVDWLEENKYIFNTIASAYQLYDDMKNKSYVMVAQPFIDKFYTPEVASRAKESYIQTIPVLKIHSKEEKNIVYRRTKDIVGKEQAMRDMNASNSQHSVVDEHGSVVNTLYARIYREGLAYNGRMYSSGIMNIENHESKGRLKLQIESQNVVEIDYEAIHTRMFADMHGYRLPEGDVYTNILPEHLRTKENRNAIKGAVNRMLNCETHASAVAAVRGWLTEVDGHTLDGPAHVTKLIYEFMGDLKDKLYKEYKMGLRLANIESNIMSDVVAEFVKQGKPILPVHDSAIVLIEDKELLARTMADCYRKHLDVSRLVPMKYNMWIDGQEIKEHCSF